MSWRTTKTPKRKTTLIKIRYKDSEGKVYVGNFFWSDTEKTWLESRDGPDGVGLYEDDGWEVLGWKEISVREPRVKVIAKRKSS